MTDQQKIYDWCDRQEKKNRKPYALQVYIFTLDSTDKRLWAATVQEFDEFQGIWISQSWITKGSTPEEAIAKLAKVLGL